jgi:hypothetical protein
MMKVNALAVAALLAIPSASFGSNPTIEWSAAVVYAGIKTPILNGGNIVLPSEMTYAGWVCTLQRETRLKSGQFARSITCNVGNVQVQTTAACFPTPRSVDNGFLGLIVGDERISLFVFCDVAGPAPAPTPTGVSL